MLTVMLEDFALVAALPEYATLLGAHNLPRTQIYDTLVGSVLEENSGRNRKVRDSEETTKGPLYLVSEKGAGETHMVAW
jgi:hypothetical protein